MNPYSKLRPIACRIQRAQGQGGAVLIVALILLAVLTLLGVTALTNTSLEEKMAANTQESTRAFQIAETGLPRAVELCPPNPAPVICGPLTVAVHLGDSSKTKVGEATVTGRFNGWSPPPIGSLYSATRFRAAHFDFQSRGETWAGNAGSGVATTHHSGRYQITSKSPF